jgi:hypothetical protein
MFAHKLGENTELRLLEERHAEVLTNLTDRNREHLQAWLPWVDGSRTVEDRKTPIRGALKQFAEKTTGSRRASGTKGAWWGWSVITSSTGRTAAPPWATGSARGPRARGSRPPRVGHWWSTPSGALAEPGNHRVRYREQ